MDHTLTKNHLIYLLISFLTGLLIGSTLVLLFYPKQECEVPVLESVDNSPEELSENVKQEETFNVDKSDTFNNTVSLPVSRCSIVVDIAGAVSKPGVYCLEEGSNIYDAVELAKGFVEGIAHKYVSMKMNLSSNLTNHQKIYIPFESDVYCELKSLQYVKDDENGSVEGLNQDSITEDTPSCININTATKDQLTTLDGVGESTAQKIIDGRPYSETADILNVSGIGEATYEKFKDDICVY